jgi:glycosyltransferase involved in cell wall biosynthesis
LSAAAIPVTFLGKRLGFDPRMMRAIRHIIRTHRPDVVHTHRAVLQYALPALLESGAPVIHTVHNIALQEVPRIARVAHRVAFSCGVTPVAIGEMVARSFKDVYRREPAAIIPNGINTAGFERPASAGARWRSQEGLGKEAVVCATVARFAAQKNLHVLVEAFKVVAAIEPKAVLVLAGDGPERDSLEQSCVSLRRTGRVRFLGRRSDVPDLLAASDVFVLSSKWEGNPLSVMEAMAAGLPVLSTAVGGVPELIQDGVTGRLIAEGSTSALADAILAMTLDRSQRIAMGHAARQRARALFDKRAMANGYAAIYDQQAARRKRKSQ